MTSITDDLQHRLRGILLDRRYRLGEVVGSGGMGAVFRAVDERLGREVAVKVILVGGLTGDDLVRHRQRFEREARLVSRIRHPNVVTVHDFGTDTEPETGRELDFIVMALLRGESLAEWLPRLSVADLPLSLSLLLQTANGVAAGHQERIVHRDIKPSNVIVVPGRDPRRPMAHVVDFGIAKPLRDDGEFGEITVGPGFVGTAAYASPEQLQGCIDPGPESDVFSLGVVGYELLTRGTRPFTDGDRTRLSQRLFVPLRPPRGLNARIPPTVEKVIVRALATHPADRFADAEAFVSALEAAWSPVEDGHGLGAATVTKIPRAGVATRTFQPTGETPEPNTALAPEKTSPNLTEPEHEQGGRRARRLWLTAGWTVVVLATLAGIGSSLFLGPGAPQELVLGQHIVGELTRLDRALANGVRYDVYHFRRTTSGPATAVVHTPWPHVSIQWGRTINGAWENLIGSESGTQVRAPVPADGSDFFLRVQGDRADVRGPYSITVYPGLPAIHAGDTVSGTLGSATPWVDGVYVESWSYRGRPGERVSATLDSDERSDSLEWGRMLDGRWRILEADQARLTVTPSDSAEYHIRVRSRTPRSHTYSLALQVRPVEFRPGESPTGTAGAPRLAPPPRRRRASERPPQAK